ncbi:MAG: homoserine dehydrogenase, partial [Myxococcales bacterium]|nr:homoserine dehydrogenase [Myxococcales bacterium]
TFDIEGVDVQQKLAILMALATGAPVDVHRVHREGITQISALDIEGARDLGCRIKLLAIAKRQGDRIEARVHPTMVPEDNLLARVDGVQNAVFVRGDAVGPTMFIGPGAGARPTASAVLGDLFDAARNLLAGCPRRVAPLGFAEPGGARLALADMDEWVGEYYLRFTVVDSPGVLAKIAQGLGHHGISIKSMIQHGRDEGAEVPIIIMTHDVRERELRAAIREIDNLDVVLAKTNWIRIEWDLG